MTANLNEQQLLGISRRAEDCILALSLDCAVLVKRNWLGRPKPTPEQSAWYLGFIGRWGETCLANMGLSGEYVVDFTAAVFEDLFSPIGNKIANRALDSIRTDGPLSAIALEAASQFDEWDGGQFVPIPPST